MAEAGGDNNGQYPVLVGREREIETIERSIDAVLEGRTHGVALVGGAGIGKTSLISRAARLGAARSMLVITGRCTEFEREVPYRLVIDTLDGVLAARGVEWFKRLDRDHLVELARVHPALEHYGSARRRALQSERHRFHAAFRAVVGKLAHEQPLMVVHDDIHWADQESVETLSYALSVGTGGPVMGLLAFRPHRASERLAGNLQKAERIGALTILQVPPLSEGDSHRLLGSGLSPATRRALYHDSGGNPFFLIQMARAARDGASPFGTVKGVPQAELVPAAVRAAITQELESLSIVGRALARAAAVAGEPFDLELAILIADISTGQAQRAVEELIASGLARRTRDDHRLTFTHPIVRQIVYESAGTGATLAAHRRAAEILEQQGAPLPVRAHHVERSVTMRDSSAAALLERAADELVQRAPVAAARWLALALRVLPDAAPSATRVRILTAHATALASTGNVEESRTSLLEALMLVPDSAGVVRARLVGSIVRLDHMIARDSEPSPRLAHAVEALGRQPTPESTALRLEYALDLWFCGHNDALVTAAAALRTDAYSMSDRLASATGLALEGIGRSHEGDTAAAELLITEATRIVDGLTDGALAARLEVLVALGRAEYGAVDRALTSVRHLERGIAVARRTGQDAWYVALICSLGIANLLLGRLPAAESAARDAVESTRLGEGQLRVWALALASWTQRLLGNLEAAGDLGEEAVAAARDGGGPFSWFAICCAAAAQREAGDAASCRDGILTAGGGPELITVPRTWRPYWYAELVLAAVALEDYEGAERWVGRAESAASASPTSSRLAAAGYARAVMELANRHPGRAHALALDAQRAFEKAGWAVDAARAQALAGRAATGIGRHDDAVALLRRAHSEFKRLGAKRMRDEAALQLRQLGERVARPGTRGRGTGIESLSGREHEIAELVSQGLTNRQIAAALYLSVKTVESHLSRIYEKLGVASRAGLAGAVTRSRATQ